MQICVLGAGVVGLTTAFALAEQGHDVTVVDRGSEPAGETSARNGAQLSFAYVAPLASPAILAKIPGLLLDPDGPLRVKPQFDLHFLRWSLEFLAACRERVESETIIAQLALSAISRAELTRLTSTYGLSFGLRTPGKLVLTRDAKKLGHMQKFMETMRAAGIEQHALTASQCLEKVPQLRLDKDEFAGGIFTPSEQVGDCATFCAELSRRLLQRNNVKWVLNTHVHDPVIDGGRLRAVTTSNGDIDADQFVLSLGSDGRFFARRAGFYLPVYPLKGYSMTTQLSAGALAHSVTDSDLRIVYAPMCEGPSSPVRIAGIADLVGYSRDINKARFESLRRAAAKTFPIIPDGADTAWTGLRPATPDSRPIIGLSPLKGLFLNTGHGGLGWTLACGSAKVAASMLSGGADLVKPGWFSLTRR